MILAIDFDGTIVDHIYPEIGELKPNAKEIINRLHEEGHEIIIWTCRNGEHEVKVREFLDLNGIKFHTINEHLPRILDMFDNDCRKIYGDIYIDDRMLGGLPPWERIYTMIQNHVMIPL